MELELNQHPIYTTQAWDSTKAAIELELSNAISSLKSAGFEVVILIHFGDVAEEIVNAIKQREIDLVMLATHARKGIDRMLNGSISEQVLRHTVVPVLMVQPEHRESNAPRGFSRNVLIPVDTSDFSRTAFKHAVRLLRPDDYHITLLQVAATPDNDIPPLLSKGSLDPWTFNTNLSSEFRGQKSTS
jgi:nucleotide-binding universal stress UspA family protein